MSSVRLGLTRYHVAQYGITAAANLTLTKFLASIQQSAGSGSHPSETRLLARSSWIATSVWIVDASDPPTSGGITPARISSERVEKSISVGELLRN